MQTNEQATVVINVDVNPDRESDYVEWQRRVNLRASEFPGYVASEIVPPIAGTQNSWTCIYRFDSPSALAAWLTSPVRQELLKEGGALASDTRQFALGSRLVDDSFTLVAAHRVGPQEIDRFLEVQQKLAQAETTFPGCSGYRLLRPVAGVSDEWTALVRFDSEEAAKKWMASPERKNALADLESIVDHVETKIVGSSFGNWFSFDMANGRATPNWKQWLVVLLALYPTVMILQLVTNYLPGGVHSSLAPSGWFYLNMWMGNFLSTLALTFLIMPWVTRGLQFWLKPNANRSATLWGLLLVICLYSVSILIFGFLCVGGC